MQLYVLESVTSRKKRPFRGRWTLAGLEDFDAGDENSAGIGLV
jgi:hypothetical protein